MEIIYIAGSGRSGSTLLDMIIGSQADAFSSGELSNLISAYLSGDYCACGVSLDKCDFWKSTISDWRVENELSEIEIKKFAKLDSFYSHPKKIRAWLSGMLPVYEKEYKWYLSLLKSLYEKISMRTGASVVTDSSKSPVRLLHLRKISERRVKVIHLLRSPYGIIGSLSKSWSKDKEKGIQKKIYSRKPLRTAIYWVVINYMVEFSVWFMRGCYFRLKYEDLVSCPEEALKPVFADFEFIEPINGEHISSGNRMRLSKEVFVVPVKEVRKPSGFMVNLVLKISKSRYGY